MACQNNSDCISNTCKNNMCSRKYLSLQILTSKNSIISAPETCNDKIKNQDETDVDCGGNICPKCSNTMTCKNASDCVSNVCKNNTCVGKGLTINNFKHCNFFHFSA